MNRMQHRQLQLYLHFRNRDVSVSAMFHFNWRIYTVILATAVLTMSAMLYVGLPTGAELIGAAYVVLVLRDVGYFRRMKRTWPLTRELLDWPKVERMAKVTP